MSMLESNIRGVLAHLLPSIQALHQHTARPIILGISGLQGSGKSTWASTIVRILTSENNFRTITISLDDLYKSHDGLVKRREKDPENKIYRTRGQPGTHDEQFAAKFFEELREYRGEGVLKIPSFDKSRFGGEGDRVPESEWPSTSTKPDLVIFEGWCVGFRPLSDTAVKEKYELALAGQLPVNTPANHKLEHLLEVNESLRRYCDTFMGPQHFDFMIHIDADDLRNVYRWRLEQEHKLIEAKGTGMNDEDVEKFIDGYMPGYELYVDKLRGGFFDEKEGRQVRVVLNLERGLEKIEVI